VERASSRRKGYNRAMRRSVAYGRLGLLWIPFWLMICAVVGDLFAERHFVLGIAALAGVVWGSMRWVRPATPR